MAVTALRRAPRAALALAVSLSSLPHWPPRPGSPRPRTSSAGTSATTTASRLIPSSPTTGRSWTPNRTGMRLVSIGKTAEGRDQWMMIITSPANFAKLDRYKEISSRLARAEGLTDEQARALAREGKAVVWIDGGLHATEVLGAHQLMEHVWQMASQQRCRDAPDSRRRGPAGGPRQSRRDGAGLQLVHAPGRQPRRTSGQLPRLYQKYIGHDNNRDHYLNAMPESENMSRILYREWNPQIMYNHHQTGPAGTVMFAPPFRDPHNHTFDPLVVDGVSLVGAAMHARFSAEGKPRRDATQRGELSDLVERRAPDHGLLPQHGRHPDRDDRQPHADSDPVHPGPPGLHRRPALPDDAAALAIPAVDRLFDHRQSRHPRPGLALPGDLPLQHLRDGAELDRAGEQGFLDHVPRAASTGSRPKRPRSVPASRRRRRSGGAAAEAEVEAVGGGALARKYWDMLHRPESRDPRGYILPSDQPDFVTATKFMNALIKSGIDIHHATGRLRSGARATPRVPTSSSPPRRSVPTCSTCSSPRTIPTTFPIPGGPPRAPYDNAGYTSRSRWA